MSVVSSPAPRIPDYELLRLIGGGSYGDVWLARGITGAFRAVKIVWRDRFPNPRPFAREFEGITRFAAVSLREPSQLALLHAGRDDAAGMFYYVMELADDAEQGRVVDPATYRPLTLREVQSRRGRLPVSEVITLGAALARALASLHAAGLVHRDVKQSNVIFVGGVPKLADVGLVTSASAPEVTFVGTEGFVPPEGPGAPPADVFSLGKLLYELATGVDRTEFPRLPPDFAQWPDHREFMELNEVLLRACEGDARRRYADAGALLDELLLLQAGKSVRRMRRTEQRLSRALRVAAVFGVVAAVAGAGAWIERQRANSEMQLRAAAEAERDALARRSIYAARLTQAQQALERDDFGRARRFLAECEPTAGEPDLRGFEWQALQDQAAGDPARVWSTGGVAGLRVCVSPDGRHAAVLLNGAKVQLWSIEDGTLERAIDGMTGLAAFSPDGRWLLGTGAGGRLNRWSVADGRAEGEGVDGVYAPLGWVDEQRAWVLAVDANGVVLALRCWDFAAGKVTAEISLTERLGGRGYYAVAFAPDGSAVMLATRLNQASEVGWRLHVWRLSDLAFVREWDTPHRPTALAVAGDQLFCGWGDSGEVESLRLSDGATLWRATLGRQPAALAWHDGRLAVGGRASSVWVLDAATGSVLCRWRGLESDAQGMAWLPGGGVLATGNGGDVRVWGSDAQARAIALDGFANPAAGGRALCLSVDGALVAGTAADGEVCVAETATGSERARFVGIVAPLTFDEDSVWLLTQQATLEKRPLTTGAAATVAVPLPFVPLQGAMALRAGRAVISDRGARLGVVSLAGGAPITRDSGHTGVWWVALSSDGKLVATGGRDGFVRLWRAETLELVREWKPARPAVNGSFSPDDRWLVWGQNNGDAGVREVAGERAHTIATSSSILQAVTFHPRAPRLFLGGREGIVHVVDTRDWREQIDLHAALPGRAAGNVVRAAASDDGAVLAGYLEEGVLRIWRAPSGR
jgi:WD40 repeat protein